ncbi:hypothetical protein [Candidatus Pantoea multigeneris]|uniref:Immunity protein 52 domain-containing protein n=1 Tax=Candidatus Pantoea multigeneris TaxID=2608357 RepID=A0ABX0R9N7_9GAMM|nr:hypothetical protein [Pantoea multigeneris]NIF22085.1 hypothetical protein [Pantoea multigeneris]
MYTAIAIYGTENITPEEAFYFGKRFFECINLSVTKAGYYKYLTDGDHKGDHDIFDVSFSDLEKKINDREVTSFRLYNDKKGSTPWLASFGYTTNEFGGFFHLDAQCISESLSYHEIICFIEELSISKSLSYGIAYSCDKMSKAFYYAAGNNLANIFPYENSSLFKKETPGRFQGEEKYKNIMLRMVYPVNILNGSHILIDVGGIPLRDWISKDEGRGVLKKLNNGSWLWQVEENSLESINKCLGDLGILISWRITSSKMAAKKIP